MDGSIESYCAPCVVAVSKDMAEWYTAHLQTFYADKPEKLNEILCSNALKLFLGPT